MKRLAVLLCGVLLLASAARATVLNFDSYVQTMYDGTNGLSCGEANDIAQTNNGILWIGTYAGLYRYNGSEFRLMSNYASVRNVNCLYVDEEGRLWIGTNDSGISICINDHLGSVITTKEGLLSNSVRCINKSTDGSYYVGTSNGLTALVLSNGITFLGVVAGVPSAVRLSAGNDGFMAAVTSDGVLCLVKDTKLLASLHVGVEEEIFTTCAFGSDGLLYAGTSRNHIYCLNVSSGAFEMVPPQEPLVCGHLSNINRIYFAEDDTVLVCADNGIGCFNSDRDFFPVNTAPFNNSIDNMLVDYQGNYWFTSSRLGLLSLSPAILTDVYRQAKMPSAMVNSVAQWDGALYVGTDEGLSIIEDGQAVWNGLTRLFYGVRIRCLSVASDGVLWVCTYGQGLFAVSPGGSVQVYSRAENASADGRNVVGDRVRAVIELSDKSIAAASDAGVSFIKDGTVVRTVPQHTALGASMVLSLMELDSETLLAGTNGDGIAVIKKGKVLRTLTVDDGLTSSVILRTVKDGEGGVFIVASNGLCHIDADFKVRPLDNFPYYDNYDVWLDKNARLFVASSAGIFVVSKNELLSGKKSLRYELFNAKRGFAVSLTANSWNCTDENGVIYLSCRTGVYALDMNGLNPVKKSYRMMVSSIALDGIPFAVDRNSVFTVSRDCNRIEIFPEVVNYTTEDPLVRYWLEGYDVNPTDVLQSALTGISYTNLFSGEYVFHLAVLENVDGEMQVLEQSSYRIVKEKHLYDTRLFHIYMLFVGMLAVGWFTWFVVRTQIQRTLAIQKKELDFAREQMENLALFSKFTNTTVAEAISTKTIDFRPHLKDCTILFSDIRGFTAISDSFRQRFGRNSAAKIITFLNDYLGRMVNCVAAGGGTVDKFEGDAIMAVWGMMRKGELAYERLADDDGRKEDLHQQHLQHYRVDALNCIKSALAMRCALMEYNEIADKDSSGNLPHLRIGCGINSGRVTAGIMGGEQKLEFTAIGDAVNLASRTEGASKFCGADILITEYTYNIVKNANLLVERIPVPITVKGKGDMYFYAVVNMPDFNPSEFLSDDMMCVGMNGAGAFGPKTLTELRMLLDIPEPDYVKVGEEERKVFVHEKAEDADVLFLE